MSESVATMDNAAVLERVVVGGNLAELKPAERMMYYRAVCESVGLNPLTKPFEYITLNGKLTLYAKRDCTDQLRSIHGVSITKLEREVMEGVYTVTAYATDNKGRTDSSIGAVPVDKLYGEAKANAMMKAETKAKRRVTLSLCGLGMLDESETESIPGAVVGEPVATHVTTVASDAPMVTPEQEERNTNIAEASRLSKALNLTRAEKRAFMLEHLGSETADVFACDPAALKAMVDDMKKREPKA